MRPKCKSDRCASRVMAWSNRSRPCGPTKPSKDEHHARRPTCATTRARCQRRMLRRAALVLNPAAGRGEGDDLATIRTLLEPHFDLTVHETSPEQDSDACAKRALDD